MPPGCTSSWRRRNWRPPSASGSFDRSVVARTTSVTPFAAAVLRGCPLPSATRLSAGHSPALATPVVTDSVPATSADMAMRCQRRRRSLLELCMIFTPIRLVKARRHRTREASGWRTSPRTLVSAGGRGITRVRIDGRPRVSGSRIAQAPLSKFEVCVITVRRRPPTLRIVRSRLAVSKRASHEWHDNQRPEAPMQHAAQALDRFPLELGFRPSPLPERHRPALVPAPPENHGRYVDGTPGDAADPPQRIDMRCLAQYRAPLLRFATLMLRNQAEAEDVVQDTLLAALQSATFAGRSSVKTWLVGILKHKINDAFRRGSRYVPLQDADDVESLDDTNLQFTDDGHWRRSPSHWSDPEAALSQRKFFELLERCIGSLPKNTAQVFIMREVMGMETEQICEAVGITRSNCFVMLHRARTKLRAQLEQLWFGGDASELGSKAAAAV